MLHFYPELAALYHRSLFVSLDPGGKQHMWDEWTQELWNFCPEKTTFYGLKPETGRALSAFFCASLGKRNKDDQKIMGFCSSLEDIESNPHLLDYTDSLFVEVDMTSESSDRLFKWQAGPNFSSKKIVWCMRSAFSDNGSLHEKALDKKMVELSPDSLRIFWPNPQFMRDALEWVLSF